MPTTCPTLRFCCPSVPLPLCVKGLKGRLTEHQHKLYQVLDEGKHLLLSVCCPALENQLALLGEHWLNNTSKVNKELQRLEAILKHWTRSETHSNTFKTHHMPKKTISF